MKVVVISDTHGNITNLKHVLGFATKIRAWAIIHCGDWDNLESVRLVLSYRLPLYSILGNADIDPNIEKILHDECKKFDRVFLNFELHGKRVGVIHNVRHLTSNIGSLNIVFCGHTHRQGEWTKRGLRVVNPGALENEINFAVYDTKTDEVEFIHE